MSLVSSTVQGNASELQKQAVLRQVAALTRGYGSRIAAKFILFEANISADNNNRGTCKAELTYDVEVDEGCIIFYLSGLPALI
jgi:hypothetical protein